MFATNQIDITQEIVKLYDASVPGNVARPNAPTSAAPKTPPASKPAAPPTKK
jgi:hypothetical protein